MLLLMSFSDFTNHFSSRFDKEPQASAQVDKLMDVMVSLMKENAKSTVFESFKVG